MSKSLWSPDNTGEYHLGDLMHNLEESKKEDKMKERFAMIRSNDDGTFEFIPGIDGKDETIPDEKVEEYHAFWDKENHLHDLYLPGLISKIINFFGCK